MGVYRENITWKSPADGLWYAGFYSFEHVNEGSPDFDHEWDVVYDQSRFSEVTPVGLPTPEAAFLELCRHHPNPDGGNYTDDPVWCARYDDMAGACRKRGAR